MFSVLIHNAEKGHLEHHIQANHIKFYFNVNSSQEESYKCPCSHKQLSTIYHFKIKIGSISLQRTWNSLQRISKSLQWSMCVCIYQSNRSADIDQWCVWVCRKHRTACRECQWACNDPCVSASIIATQLQTWTNDVFESAENTDQPAQNIKEPAMIHVWLHLSEQENWRHQPMMCWQRTNSFPHKY